MRSSAVRRTENELRTRCHHRSLVRSQNYQDQQEDPQTTDMGHCWTGELQVHHPLLLSQRHRSLSRL